jgi:predicted DNA-binding transcriptional regulator AlpA
MTAKLRDEEEPLVDLRNATGEQLLTKKQVGKKLGISGRSVDRYIAEGVFPSGFKIGSSLVRWRVSVVEAWIRDQSSGGAG